jgi:hypothetical protein
MKLVKDASNIEAVEEMRRDLVRVEQQIEDADTEKTAC